MDLIEYIHSAVASKTFNGSLQAARITRNMMREEDNCAQSEPLAFSWLHTACDLMVGSAGAFLNDCDRTDMRQEWGKYINKIQLPDWRKNMHLYKETETCTQTGIYI